MDIYFSAPRLPVTHMDNAVRRGGQLGERNHKIKLFVPGQRKAASA